MRAIAVLLLFVTSASAQYRFPPVFHDYAGGSRLAQTEGKYLVTYVGCRPQEVQNVVVCTILTLPDYPAQCVVISKDGFWKVTINGVPSVSDVQKEVDRCCSSSAVTTFQRIIAAPVYSSGGRSANC